MIIRHGVVYTPYGFVRDYGLRSEGERIAEIGPDGSLHPRSGEPAIDAQGRFVIPGFVDLHVHGAAGADTMDATPQALAAMATFFASHGVTGFLATTITAPQPAILAAAANVAAYLQAPRGGARVLGLHLEGPYVNRAAKGAQPEEYCRPPSQAEFDQVLAAGPVRLISLAPELPGAESFVSLAVARGVRVAAAHTQATYEELESAVGWGITQAVHTFNAMTGLHHRRPGAVGAVLTDDRLVGEVIADGIHLHPAIVALVVRAKTPRRVALITDGLRATGLPPGTYDLGGQDVIVQDDACWLTDAAGNATRTLAGSILTMDVALRNAMRMTGLSLAEALPMATEVPAGAIGLAGETGTLRPGALADVVLLDEALRVHTTIVGGQVVYEAHAMGGN